MALLTLDFETYYDRDYSLSSLTTEGYVRDSRFEVILVGVKEDKEPPRWFTGSMREIKDQLLALDIPNQYLLCHNAAFDGLILSHHFGIVPKFYLDTMSMAKPKHGMTIGVSLKALSDHYTVGMKGDEIVRTLGRRCADFTPEQLGRYGQYCCNDVQLTYMLLRMLKPAFPMNELKIIDLMIRMFTIPHLGLDKDRLTTHLAKVQLAKQELLERAGAGIDQAVLQSNPKLVALLRSYGVEPPTKISPATGKETFALSRADPAFLELLDHTDERVQAVVAARLGVKSTLEETRTKALLGIADRGPLPVLLNYYGGHTGRASGGDKINLQNLPRGGELRKAITAPDGYTLVVADSAQIEARVLAWLAGQDDLVRGFANDEDVYAAFASKVYDRPIEPRVKSTERHVGKTCILGLGYGMGAEKLGVTLAAGKPPVVIEAPRTTEIVRLYRHTYPHIKRLWDRGSLALYAVSKSEDFPFGRDGLLHTSAEGVHLPNGMLIRYPGLTLARGEIFYASSRREQAEWVKQQLAGKWDSNLLTRIYGGKVIENVVQALARIVVFEQMLLIAKRYRISLTVHDEIVACVPLQETEAALEFVKEAMCVPPQWAVGLPLACETHAHRSYGEAK